MNKVILQDIFFFFFSPANPTALNRKIIINGIYLPTCQGGGGRPKNKNYFKELFPCLNKSHGDKLAKMEYGEE